MTDLIDNSVANPGKMGWGFEHETTSSKRTVEAALYADLAERSPDMVCRRAAKEPSTRVMQLVNDAMAADGIEGGFSCRHVEKVTLGEFQPWLAQLIGSCVASGGMRAMARRILIEVFLLGDPEELPGLSIHGKNNLAPFAPYSYRAGRKILGMNGYGDGSHCGAHVRGAMTDGILLCSTQGLDSYTDDFPEPQDERTYREWGASDRYLSKFAAAGRIVKLLESERIEAIGDLKSALTEHQKPMMICSDWAFRPDYVHPTWKYSDGSSVVIYKRDRSTSWQHNMTVDGWLEVGGDDFTETTNSWGVNAHKNGDHFIIPSGLMEEWLRSADVQTIGDIDLVDSQGPV